MFSLVLPPKKKLVSALFSCFQGEGAGAIGTAAEEEEDAELTATSGAGPPFCPPLMLLPPSTGAGCDARKGAVAGAERGGGSVAGTDRGAAGLAPRAEAAGASGEEGLVTSEGPEAPSEKGEEEAAVAAVFPPASKASSETEAAS